MKLSRSLFGGALLASFAVAMPALAETPASISGSATLGTPSGITTTVSGESILASGYLFNTVPTLVGATGSPISQPAAAFPAAPLATNPNATLSGASAIVVPTYSVAGSATFVANTLSVASSGGVVTPGNLATAQTNTSFSAAAATVLTQAAGATPSGAGAVFGGGTYRSVNIEFITAIIKAGSGVNGLD